MNSERTNKIVNTVILALGLGMAGVLLFSLFTYIVWLLREHEAYFWVFYINKAFYSFQLPVVFCGLLIVYRKLLVKLTMECSLAESLAGYLVILVLIVISVLGGISESGEIFYLYGKY